MRKKVSYFVLSILFSGLLAGCGGMSAAASNKALLERNQPWRLQVLSGQRIANETSVTLSFGADGQISGNGGCNRFFSGYSIGPGDSLNIGQIGSTKMYCVQSIDLEQRFFSALGEVTRFAVDDRSLRLFYPDGVLEFTTP